MDPAERFIEAATAPLAETNAEFHLAAQQELRERIVPGDSDALDAAAVRLERVKRPRWIKVLLILMSITSLLVVGLSLSQYKKWRAVYNVVNFTTSVSDEPPALRKLSPEQQLLLHGDPSCSSPSDRWKALWDSRPDYPPYFANYVGHHVSEHNALPPDCLKIASEIDSDNGWYWAMAAACEGKDNAKRASQSTPDREAGIAPTWTIADDLKQKATIELMEVVISKPRFTDYRDVLLKQQIPLLPKRSDYMSQFPTLIWFAGQTNFSFKLRPVTEVLAAEAVRCATDGDIEGFERLQRIQKHMAIGSAKESNFLIDALIAKVFVSAGVRNFRDAASQLSLTDDAEAYEKIDAVLNPDKKERERRADQTSDLDILTQKKGGVLTSLTFPMVSRQSINPVPYREDEIAPARRAEHALFGRVACLAIWAILGLALGGISLIRPNPLASSPARRLRDLFQPSDWAWIIGVGILVPMIWHLLIAQLSPLAAHHWSMRTTAFILPGAQFGATALMMIVLPILVIRWRMKLRMPFLRFRQPRLWLAWLAAASSAIAIPALGILPQISGMGELFFALIGFPLLWLLGVAFKAIFLNKDRTIASRTIADTLIPTYALGMILILLCVPLFHLVEKHWIQFDHISEITTEEASFTRYEYRVTQQLKSELLEIYGELP